MMGELCLRLLVILYAIGQMSGKGDGERTKGNPGLMRALFHLQESDRIMDCRIGSCNTYVLTIDGVLLVQEELNKNPELYEEIIRDIVGGDKDENDNG